MSCPTCGTASAADATTCRACGAPLAAAGSPHALGVGTELYGGALVVEGVLGQGGFGITYRGRDRRLGRAVAIKEFFPQGCGRVGSAVRPGGGVDAEEFRRLRERFLEEARVLARFQHPGIVPVYSAFEENETAYAVMELLEGKSLAQLLEERGPLPEPEAVGYIERVGEAMGEVHAAGLLHRDLKPENVIVSPAGRVTLIDFGTARAFSAGSTRRMTTLLTPGYAPLEQYSQQARFGAFTDVYGLAATLYHLLTGQPPTPALDRIQGVALPPPHALNPAVRPATSDAVMRGLAMAVKERPQSVAAFMAALHGSPPAAVPAARPALGPPSVAAEPPALDLGRIPHGQRGHARLRLTVDPRGSRLSGTAALVPPLPGVRAVVLAGAAPEVQVSVDTASLPAGSAHRAELVLDTNAGALLVPVRFRVGVPWGGLLNDLAGSVAAASVLGAVARVALATAIQASWLRGDPGGQQWQLATFGFGLLLLAALAAATRSLWPGRAGSRGSCFLKGIGWLLGLGALACGGGQLVARFGAGLVLSLDRLGQAWSPTLPTPLAWAAAGALVGLLEGVALALARSGRPTPARLIHATLVLLILVLALSGLH